MSNCKVIALTNQKGGVGKTTTAVNLGVSLVQQNKKVLLIDADAQANLTMSLGYSRPDDLSDTLSSIMQDVIDDNPVNVQKAILHHDEGVDLLPSNIELSGLEVRLINAISRESVLKTCINEVKKNYDVVLVDCMPSLGMLTINALAAADSVVIPTQPHYLSAKGLELLLRSVSKVKRQINPHLRIDGILMTMVMPRTNISKEITATVKSAYGQRISGEIPEQDMGIDEISDEQDADIPADPNVRNFSFALVDGRVYFRENNKMTPAKVSVTAENRIKGLLEIRDCVRNLIQYQTDDYPEEMIQSEQENLNRLYDAFTKKYGLINSRGNYLAFAADESYFLLCSLEVLDDEGKFKRKADMFSKRTIKPHREVTFVETASEALALSIGEKARVDLSYMAQLTGKTQEEIIKDLQGVIYKVPSSEPARYVTADEYLSGNVREKLKIAGIAAKADPEFAVNVSALEKVIPKDLPASEISVRLGTTWIPQEDIQQFMVELLTPSSYAVGRLKVRYTAYNGDWFIENKSSDVGNVKADSTYGTKRASAYRIIEDTLNLRDTRIFDYVYDEHNNKKAVLNHKETTAAQAKQEVIKQAFQDWVWKDPERRNRLVRYYNDTFNSIRPREYDGSHITFGGISPEIKLRPHQVNAIAHILYGGNTLLAHKVGAGKTFEMVAAAQESKRLGLCQKSMFVVPNHLVGQWASEYLRLYPSANILVTTKRDFETGNRKKFCGRIATGAYDAVIIGHSQFEKIPISEERQREQLMRQLDDIERGIDDVQASHGEQFTVKQLMKTRKAIKAKLDKLNDTKRKDSVINFEELGIDRLFIDESHFYKNLYLFTKMRNVGGIAQTEAQKSSDLFMKCRYLDDVICCEL